jgi:hypothetical protein
MQSVLRWHSRARLRDRAEAEGAEVVGVAGVSRCYRTSEMC